jgi:hypothetical protein
LLDVNHVAQLTLVVDISSFVELEISKELNAFIIEQVIQSNWGPVKPILQRESVAILRERRKSVLNVEKSVC